MKLSQIEDTEALMLTPADVAEVLGVDAQSIRVQARQDPSLLGFPVSVVGNRTLIPRIPFLKFIGGNYGE